MSGAHTPGPWLVATSNSWRRIVSQRGDVVCGPCNQPDGHPDLTFPNGGAEGPDARVLIAAPDLLREAEKCLAWFCSLEDWSGVGDPDVAGLHAAIAKARGEQI